MKAIISVSLAALLASGPCVAATAGKGVGVWDLGRDGKERYYQIQCGDGRKLVVAGDYEKKQTCFPSAKGEDTCLKSLDIRNVGERACAATAPQR